MFCILKPVTLVCYSADEIYSWSRFTPLDKVRVVILGQDPYHNNGQAHGELAETAVLGIKAELAGFLQDLLSL